MIRSRRAAIYTRMSSDDGSALGVERQRRDCEALVRARGWAVAGVYTDNDTSNFTRRPRPAYERMLADLTGGVVDALAVWDVDRLTRTPVELERIIDIAERHDVALASVGGEIDLATPQGRLTARIKASVARHEVEQSSRRIRRKTLERAEAGKPHGRVAYGWRRLDGVDVIAPEQAAVISEAAARALAGESLRSVTRSLNERGTPTPNGVTHWEPTMLRQVLLRERNAGLRRHQGRVIGRGSWEPIFTDEDYQRLVALLRDPRRRLSSSGAHKHLLSGLARCGLCDHSLRVLKAHGTLPDGYACPNCFGVRRKKVAVDELITALVVARLGQPDALTALAGGDASELVREAAEFRARLDVVADQYANDEIDAQQLARITARLRPHLQQLEAQISHLTAVPVLADAVNVAWEELSLARQRAVIDLMMTVRILPAQKKGRAQLDPNDVVVEWRQAQQAPSTAPQ